MKNPSMGEFGYLLQLPVHEFGVCVCVCVGGGGGVGGGVGMGHVNLQWESPQVQLLKL